MKKSLIVIALVLLMIVPIFAETVTSGKGTVAEGAEAGTAATLTASGNQETKVNVTLELTPRYAFGVTGGSSSSTVEGTYAQKFTSYGENGEKIVAVAPSDTSKKAGTDYYLYDTLPRVTVISMVADEENMIIKEPANNNYFISYWFFENNTQNVKLNVSLSGDLTLNEKSKTALTNAGITIEDEKTKIPYQITVETENGEKTITSASGTSVVVVTADITMEIGKVEVADASLKVQPLAGDGNNSIKEKYVGVYESNIILNLTVGA